VVLDEVAGKFRFVSIFAFCKAHEASVRNYFECT
jgi:hypothetical protein